MSCTAAVAIACGLRSDCSSRLTSMPDIQFLELQTRCSLPTLQTNLQWNLCNPTETKTYICWLYKNKITIHIFFKTKSTVLLCWQVAFGFQNQFWCGHHCLKWRNNEDVLPWIVFHKIFVQITYNPCPRCTQQWVWMMKPPSIIYITSIYIYIYSYILVLNKYIYIYIIPIPVIIAVRAQCLLLGMQFWPSAPWLVWVPSQVWDRQGHHWMELAEVESLQQKCLSLGWMSATSEFENWLALSPQGWASEKKNIQCK